MIENKQQISDLHVHTTCSDASRTVQEVMEYAKRIGLKYIAITDHDTMAGVSEAQKIGEQIGIQVIPGVEISTRDENTGRSVHMLCYCPKNRRFLQDFLKRTLENRRKQKLSMAEKVRELYPRLTVDMVEEYAKESESVYECHVMQGLCDLGYTNTVIGPLMESLISSKGSCFVPSCYPSTKEAAEAVKEAGGIAVIAHAEQFDSFELVERYAAEGWIQGVEVWHPRNSEESREKLRQIAEKYHLLMTGGSDFHGQYAKNLRPLGFCGCSEEDVQKLIEKANI